MAQKNKAKFKYQQKMVDDFTKTRTFFESLLKENIDLNDTEEKNGIFILGMPRSSTSLVEQIISSHSEVFGAGELPILSNIIKEKFIENDQLINNKINSSFNELSNLETLKPRDS